MFFFDDSVLNRTILNRPGQAIGVRGNFQGGGDTPYYPNRISKCPNRPISSVRNFFVKGYKMGGLGGSPPD